MPQIPPQGLLPMCPEPGRTGYGIGRKKRSSDPSTGFSRARPFGGSSDRRGAVL